MVKVAAGSFHTVALTADGLVFAWGDNRMNQLGIHVYSIVCTVVDVFARGDNRMNQLGLGPLVARGNPCCTVLYLSLIHI